MLSRSNDHFEVIERIKPNAYKVDLPKEYGVLATFNVADRSPYYVKTKELPSLKAYSFQE